MWKSEKVFACLVSTGTPWRKELSEEQTNNKRKEARLKISFKIAEEASGRAATSYPGGSSLFNNCYAETGGDLKIRNLNVLIPGPSRFDLCVHCDHLFVLPPPSNHPDHLGGFGGNQRSQTMEFFFLQRINMEQMEPKKESAGNLPLPDWVDILLSVSIVLVF